MATKKKTKTKPFLPRDDAPKYLTEDMLVYLDRLRESGATNMFGATPYLMATFPELNQARAVKVLAYWMNTFSERNPR